LRLSREIFTGDARARVLPVGDVAGVDCTGAAGAKEGKAHYFIIQLPVMRSEKSGAGSQSYSLKSNPLGSSVLPAQATVNRKSPRQILF